MTFSHRMWLILFAFLFPFAFSKSPFEYRVFNVSEPYFLGDYFGNDLDLNQLRGLDVYYETLARLEENICLMDGVCTVPSSFYPVDKRALSDDELNALQKKYPMVTANWEHFNHRTVVDMMQMDFVGPYHDVMAILAYRRVVINRTLLEEVGKFQEASANGIDYFDEYEYEFDCDDEMTGNDPQMRFIVERESLDLVLLIHGKVHYLHFNRICRFERSKCTYLINSVDSVQGLPVNSLRNATVRVSDGSTMIVNTWRQFKTCMHAHDKLPRIYPEFKERLQDLGFSDELLEQTKDLKIQLALRLFAQQTLHEWRVSTKFFRKHSLEELEHQEKQFWKFEYLKEKTGRRH